LGLCQVYTVQGPPAVLLAAQAAWHVAASGVVP
jgi:hypothetical protein